MLGRKTYTPEEIANARTAVAQHRAAYAGLATACREAGNGTGEALATLQAPFFNDLLLVLDRHFVHRLRAVAGKDTNPVTEVELLADSLIANGGVLRVGSPVKYRPEASVLKLAPGDPIRLTEDAFDRIATAFLDDIERRFR
jgi:hypothetical protein